MDEGMGALGLGCLGYWLVSGQKLETSQTSLGSQQRVQR